MKRLTVIFWLLLVTPAWAQTPGGLPHPGVGTCPSGKVVNQLGPNIGPPFGCISVSGAGAVTSVTATPPITSTGGTTPNIALTNPLATQYGGTGCNSGNATTFSGLPVSPNTGMICTITDANSCVIGSTISSGGGSTICPLFREGSSWIAGGAVAGGGGAVTSVGFATNLPGVSISGSPVTSTGTLTATLANQNANLFLAGPASGGAALPTWRLLATNDYQTNTIPKAALNFSTQPYEMHEGIAGTPAASLIIPDACAQTVNFPADFATPNSYVSCGTNPSETDDYVVKVAGTQIGDVSISTSCVATFQTVSHATKSCTAGQRIEIDGPATVSGANIAIVIAGTRSL